MREQWGGIEVDLHRTLELHERAINDDNDPDAMNYISVLLDNGANEIANEIEGQLVVEHSTPPGMSPNTEQDHFVR